MTAPRPRLWPYLLALVICVITIAVMLVQYRSLPEQIPVHWGLDGQPTRFEARSWLTVIGVPLIGALVVVMMLPIEIVRAATTTKHPTTGGGVDLPFSPSLATKSNSMFDALSTPMAVMALTVGIGTSALGASAVFPPLAEFVTTIVVAMLLIIMATALWLTLSSYRSLRRINADPADDDERERQRTMAVNANYEKVVRWAGMRYYNPSDPMVVITTDRGSGNYLINSAHPAGRWFNRLLGGGLVALLVFIVVMIAI